MNEELGKTREAIIQTMAFFDIFDYPLTSWEVWKFLYRAKAELPEIMQELKNFELTGVVARKHGFYFFAGRENIARLRHIRYDFGQKKYKKARRAARIIAFLPFVKMVAVCNNLAYSNARAESDIDFFVIARGKRIWTVRFFSVLVMKLLRMRIRKDKLLDGICLSFFLSEDALDLSKVALPEEDIYLNFWFATLTPLFAEDGIVEKFQKSNIHFYNALPHIYQKSPSSRRAVRIGAFAGFFKRVFERALSGKAGVWFEQTVKTGQMKVLPAVLRKAAETSGTDVVIDDTMLKFHSNDRRQYFQKLWRETSAKRGFVIYEKVYASH